MTNRVKAIIELVKEKGWEQEQAFDCRNLVGDEMETVLEIEGVTVSRCDFWEYLEIFGLTKEEWDDLDDILECCTEYNTDKLNISATQAKLFASIIDPLLVEQRKIWKRRVE